MNQLLTVREYVVKFIKRFETALGYIGKFLLGYFAYGRILAIGEPHELVAPFIEAVPERALLPLLALSFALFPYALSWLLMSAMVAVGFSSHIEIAAAVFVVLLLIFFFYARMAVRESVLILLMLFAFYFKMPYLVPLLAGLYGSLTMVLPVTIGIFIWDQIPVATKLAATARTAGTNLSEMPETFAEIYNSVVNSIAATQSWLFTAFVFALVVVTVYVVSRLTIDYSKEIAILLGCVITVIGKVLEAIVTGGIVSIGAVVFQTILCGALVFIVRFFDAVLDYQSAESVQFEDEGNFYYVRIVPKIAIAPKKRVVRRIRPQDSRQEN